MTTAEDERHAVELERANSIAQARAICNAVLAIVGGAVALLLISVASSYTGEKFRTLYVAAQLIVLVYVAGVILVGAVSAGLSSATEGAVYRNITRGYPACWPKRWRR